MKDLKTPIQQAIAPMPTSHTLNIQPESTSPTETSRLLLSNVPAQRRLQILNERYENITNIQFCWFFNCLMLASLVAFFDGTLMASSHPVIASYFKASNSASWLSTTFFLTLTVSQPLCGRASDLVGRRPVFLFAIAVFFLGTAWCGAALNMGSFIAARSICGLGAGGITTMTVILINDLVKLEYRGIYQSYYNIAWGLGNGLGAALGGVLCDRLGWRNAFNLQLPFVFTIGIVAWLVTPGNLSPTLAKYETQTIAKIAEAFDIVGALILILTITALTLSLNLPGTVLPWTHPIILVSLTIFFLGSCLLIYVEYNAANPILPLCHLSSSPIANLVWSNFLSAATINTVLFYLPLYLQVVRQLSPTAAGLYLLIPLVSASTAGLIAGFWVTYTRATQTPVLAGSFFFLFGAILTTALCLDPVTATTIPPWIIALSIPSTFIGQGLNWSTTTIAVLVLPNSISNPNSNSFHAEEPTSPLTTTTPSQSTTATTLVLLRSIGSTMGIALSSWIFQFTLVRYLDQNLTLDQDENTTKQALIHLITHASVSSLATLPLTIKAQVITAYVQTLRSTFTFGVMSAAGGLLLVSVVRAQLPRFKGTHDEEREEGARGDHEEGR